MNLNHADIYSKLQQINENVKQGLKRKGIVVPKKNADGSISVGKFRIIRSDQFYTILDYNEDVLYSGINLPQTAALLANELAVRHFIDKTILDIDRKYGHAVFEESNHCKLLNKKSLNPEIKDIIRSKIDLARARKSYYRHEIEEGFRKLIRIR